MTLKNLCLSTLLSLICFSCQSISDNTLGALKGMVTGELTDTNISSGLKEALDKGTSEAVATLSQKESYSNNSAYRIHIPEKLNSLSDTLRKTGFSEQIDLFESKMNDGRQTASTHDQSKPSSKNVADLIYPDIAGKVATRWIQT